MNDRIPSARPTSLAAAALIVAPLASNAIAADSADHRYADFAAASATIAVGGGAVCDAQHGYTAEARIWIDSSPETTQDRFPACIMFEHSQSTDHKWLGIHSGRGTGLAVGEGRSWFLDRWVDTAGNLPTGRWVHIAHVISAGVDRIYVDGILAGSIDDPSPERLNGANMHIGAGYHSDYATTLRSFGGKLDWIRISATARYAGSQFTVPAENDLYPDQYTKLLVTFNGTTGNDAFQDLSPDHCSMSPGIGVESASSPIITPDCNDNGIDDRAEITTGLLADSNRDGIPDICQCGANPALPVCCTGDIFQDGLVNGADLGILLSYWGPTTSAAASQQCDLNHDGIVNGADLGALLAHWGPCGG